jgi:uncharacterized protein YjaG (DUF416 family)
MNHDLFIVKPIRATCTIMRQILSKKLYFLVLAAGLSLVPTITAQEIGHQNDAKKVSQKNAPAASNSSQSEQEKKETEWDPSWSPFAGLRSTGSDSCRSARNIRFCGATR